MLITNNPKDIQMIRAKNVLIVLICLFFFYSHSAMADEQLPKVRMSTTLGDIVLELNSTRAPQTVENFLNYVNSGFYDGTIFHRVISNFMIQGGGFTKELDNNRSFTQKKPNEPIKNEANNGLHNVRGSVSMARTSDPHSATAQFFINVVDNQFLDHRSQTTRGWGYTVFGKVVEGMDIVDKIRKVKTARGGQFSKDVPMEAVEIIKISVETAADQG